MHGSKAAKDTDESEYSGRRKTLLPRLASSKDWRQWAFKTETILKQKEIWYVIENAAHPYPPVLNRQSGRPLLGNRGLTLIPTASDRLCQRTSLSPGHIFSAQASPASSPPTRRVPSFQPPARLVYASDSPLCFPTSPCIARQGGFSSSSSPRCSRHRSAPAYRAHENSFGPTRHQTHLSTLRFAKLAPVSPPPPVAAWGLGTFGLRALVFELSLITNLR